MNDQVETFDDDDSRCWSWWHEHQCLRVVDHDGGCLYRIRLEIDR